MAKITFSDGHYISISDHSDEFYLKWSVINDRERNKVFY